MYLESNMYLEHSMTLLLSKNSQFCNKQNTNSSNHVKVQIYEPSISNFDMFALDGVEIYFVKVLGKKPKNTNKQTMKKKKKKKFEKRQHPLLCFLSI